jgi:hypothetical protein
VKLVKVVEAKVEDPETSRFWVLVVEALVVEENTVVK